MGKGNKVKFWSDFWCGDYNLLIRFPLIFALAKDKQMTIEEAFDKNNGIGWHVVVNRNPKD